MSDMLKLLSAYRSLRRSQWLPRTEIRQLQEAKLRILVRDAYEYVPYYRTLFDEAGVDPRQISRLDDLGKIPHSTKSDLQAVPPEQRQDRRYDMSDLSPERTSGSTGLPFTVWFDSPFVCARNALFLRGLHAVGYRIGQKLLLITAGQRKSRRMFRWRYQSIQSRPETLVAELNRFRPAVLYGCLTPLRLMAEWSRSSGISCHVPQTVITTAESLDIKTRKLLEKTFHAPVFDFYGLTEVGLIAWECRERNGYHLSEDVTIVELVPDQASGTHQLVVTSLALRSMPLLRYQTDDLVSHKDNGECSCGRKLKRIHQIEGRMVDCLHLDDGINISPYRITCALESIAELSWYQVIQHAPDQVTVLIQTLGTATDLLGQEVRNKLVPIVGNQVSIRVKFQKRPLAHPGQPFRVVERRFTSESRENPQIHN